MAGDWLKGYAETLAECLKDWHITAAKLTPRAPDGFWKALATALNARGVRTPAGNLWTKPNAQTVWRRYGREIKVTMAELQLHSQDELQADTATPSPERYVTKDELRYELRKLMVLIQDAQHPMLAIQSQLDDYPPLPPTAPIIGIKKAGQRVKIAGTIDKALMDLIQKEAHRRGVALSTILDTMAWHYYGKPALSFQLDLTNDEG